MCHLVNMLILLYFGMPQCVVVNNFDNHGNFAATRRMNLRIPAKELRAGLETIGNY